MKVLVVDDSAFFNRMIRDIVSGFDFVTAVESASNGAEALEKARSWRPDAITLDIDMPDISGLRVLRQLRAEGNRAAVVVLSGLAESGTSVPLLASELGALDVLLKPRGSGESDTANLASRLRIILRAVNSNRTGASPVSSALNRNHVPTPQKRPMIVAIGASTGGPAAIASIVERLPSSLSVPVVIALHLAEGFTKSFAEALSRRSSVPVVEAQNGQALIPGTVYVAPGGRQMGLTLATDSMVTISVNDDEPENDCRPSVDYLFRAVADLFGDRAVALILTGMGRDGAVGLAELKSKGAFVMAQDEASCVVYGMPAAAVEAGLVDLTGNPAELAARLVALIKRPS